MKFIIFLFLSLPVFAMEVGFQSSDHLDVEYLDGQVTYTCDGEFRFYNCAMNMVSPDI